MLRALSMLILCGLSACGTQYRDTSQPMASVQDFDVSRYLGTWYEIARYPVPFQDGCTATTATYQVIDADTVSVLNQCRDGTPEGPLNQIEGRADLVGPGQLKVQFASVPFVRADYWVLWVDNTYQTAVVGVPNGRAGWILARAPQIDPDKRQQAMAALVRNGYDPKDLYEVPHAAR
jgi:apolipoprotein D and lipocalin family protein